MEFDSNSIQDDDVDEMSEQNPSEKEKGNTKPLNSEYETLRKIFN